jgi:cold shock protein
VKWFNDQKGYGFIEQDSGQKDVFVHHSDINMKGHRSLAEGQRVQFDTAKEAKGLKAVNVTVVS